MGADKYPCIGYDPARGNVDTLAGLATDLTGTATYADEARNALNAVKDNRDVWTGEAAKKFAENIEDLPGYLGDAHWAMEHAGNALKDWADELRQYRRTRRRSRTICARRWRRKSSCSRPPNRHTRPLPSRSTTPSTTPTTRRPWGSRPMPIRTPRRRPTKRRARPPSRWKPSGGKPRNGTG
ncbi:putative T7SS-secreted protein [Amycolatopsis antarctica]|uniref:putative T7SS-secreted protein n=1 Tax=Amycolatopsis antarctica TaxID=1854586 RepID=UPI00105431CC|nr:hypothetical protein [Amycolatopsis antarctica]